MIFLKKLTNMSFYTSVLLITFIILPGYLNTQKWTTPFFKMDIPNKWHKLPKPKNLESPVRERNGIREYYDVRIIPNPNDKNIVGRSVSVRIFKKSDDNKLNFRDFVSEKGTTKNIEEYIIGDFYVHETMRVLRLRDPETGEVNDWFGKEWLIQGDLRVYRFTFNTTDLDFFKENVNSVIKAINTFIEK